MTTQGRLSLFPKQDQFVFSERPYDAFVGGVGSGKTKAGSFRAYHYCTKHPGALGMITAPTFPMLRDATLRTIQEMWPEKQYEFAKGDMTLKMVNGSEILLRSTDDPDRLRGPNLAFFYMDEAAMSSGETFKILQGRLRQPGFPHQGWITTTPKGYNWIYNEFAREQREDYSLITVSSRDNPFLPPGYIEMLMESYDREFALQEIEGQFVLLGGRAYFDIKALEQMIAAAEAPLESRRGDAVKIWKYPTVAGRYVAGGDFGWGETGSYSCVVIFDWQTGEQGAEIHGRIRDDEMALETVNLLQEYNEAYFGGENNGENKNVLNKMLELGYGRRMFYQDWEAKTPEKVGWLTNGTTRPLMLGELEEAVRNEQVGVRCAEGSGEFGSFYRNDRGRPEATEGAYDDHVMAWAIGWQMRKYAKYYSGRGITEPIPLPALW